MHEHAILEGMKRPGEVGAEGLLSLADCNADRCGCSGCPLRCDPACGDHRPHAGIGEGTKKRVARNEVRSFFSPRHSPDSCLGGVGRTKANVNSSADFVPGCCLLCRSSSVLAFTSSSLTLARDLMADNSAIAESRAMTLPSNPACALPQPLPA